MTPLTLWYCTKMYCDILVVIIKNRGKLNNDVVMCILHHDKDGMIQGKSHVLTKEMH